MFDRVSKCVPFGTYDSWNHYQWAGLREETPAWAGTYGASAQSFSRFDLERFDQLRTSFADIARSPEEMDDWFEKQEATNLAHIQQIQQIEAWIESDKKKRYAERGEVREKRIEFFEKMAAQMELPMLPDELEYCPSYQRAIQIAKPPTMKSWQLLRDKIQAERSSAEAMAKKDRRAASHREYRVFLSSSYDQTRRRRAEKVSPEQRLVLTLADKVIGAPSAEINQVHESDMINVILRGIYDEYQQIDDTEKPAYGFGPYRLIMDDARLVYEEKLVPLMRRRGTAKMAMAERLQCPLISCHRSPKYFSFEKLMTHLQGPYSHICEFDFSPPSTYPHRSESLWYCLEWPRNLPALPSHQKGSDHWDVDADTPYVRATGKSLALVEEPQDEPRLELTALTEAPFTGSIIHALSAMKNNPYFNGRLKCIIALEIGRKNQQESGEDSPTGMQIDEMVRYLGSDSIGLIDQLDDHICMRCQLPVFCPTEGALKKSRKFFTMVCHYLDEHCDINSLVKSDLTLPETFTINSELFWEGMELVEQYIYTFKTLGAPHDSVDIWSDDDYFGMY